MRGLIAICLATGCTGDGTADGQPTGDSGPTSSDDSAGVFSGVDVPDPELAAEDVTSEIDAFVAIGLPDPEDMKEGYYTWFQEGDEECPGTGDEQTWLMSNGCLLGYEADSGYWYLSPGGYASGEFIHESGAIDYTISMVADGEIQDGIGSHMIFGGHWSGVRYTEPEGSGTYIEQFEGSWGWDLGTPWQVEGASGWFDLEAEKIVGGETTDFIFVLDGVLALGKRAMWFDDVIFDSATCGDHPTGAVSVRDPTGYWWRVEFPSDCSSACGPLYFEGDLASDEVCVDTAALSAAIQESARW